MMEIMDGGKTLIYSSDYPHQDFDTPASIWDQPRFTEEEKARDPRRDGARAVQPAAAGTPAGVVAEGHPVIRQFIRHRVKDYDAWRVVYDSYKERRDTEGVLADGVLRNVDDPNDLTVWHDYEDIETARTYASAPVGDVAFEQGRRPGRSRDVVRAGGIGGGPGPPRDQRR